MPIMTSDNLLSYDTDNREDVDLLLRKKPRVDFNEAWPRQTTYGSIEAFDIGLTPIEAVPDVLIQPGDYAEAVKYAHEQQNMPVYHMYAWHPKGSSYTQNGLGYCWTWGGTGTLMTTRACEDKDMQLLAPVSMGYLVNWSNSGNFLESYIKGAREKGVCPAKDWNEVNSTSRNKNYWEDEVNSRAKYRLDRVWDTSRSNMVQHCISILCYGRPLFLAYNWWGHALSAMGVRYNGSTLEWLINNSHGESDVIIMTGSKAIPDEAYGFISTVLTA